MWRNSISTFMLGNNIYRRSNWTFNLRTVCLVSGPDFLKRCGVHWESGLMTSVFLKILAMALLLSWGFCTALKYFWKSKKWHSSLQLCRYVKFALKLAFLVRQCPCFLRGKHDRNFLKAALNCRESGWRNRFIFIMLQSGCHSGL